MKQTLANPNASKRWIHTFNLFCSLLIAGLLVTVQSCEKEQVAPQDNAQKGAFKVNMTDAPGLFSSFKLEITKVEAYNETQGGWVQMSGDAHVYEITELTNGRQRTIASSSEMDAGIYSRLRLTYGGNSSASFVLAGLSISAQFSSGGESEIEIPIHVQAGANAEVLLDFHAAESMIQQGGEYILRPVITVINDTRTGVSGHVEGSAVVTIEASNGSGSFSTFADANGDFLIRGMEQGDWDLTFHYAGSLGLDGELQKPDVVVVKGSITSMGTIVLNR